MNFLTWRQQCNLSEFSNNQPMENSMNEFSIVVFIIQMAVLFAIIGVVHYLMKAKKKRMEKELNEHPNQSV